jgi:hypothetical protein
MGRIPRDDEPSVLLLQDLLQSCARGGRRRVEDMCYERRRAEACVDESAHRALEWLRPVRNWIFSGGPWWSVRGLRVFESGCVSEAGGVALLLKTRAGVGLA